MKVVWSAFCVRVWCERRGSIGASPLALASQAQCVDVCLNPHETPTGVVKDDSSIALKRPTAKVLVRNIKCMKRYRTDLHASSTVNFAKKARSYTY